ncbi:hypothetical protein MgSA37_01863 [Mucilaginibacter gotjawali]|uniref:TonB-dependent transporter Oar-like beta-barrel domain-containing protein n=2 Tax=Mucilaginibacter gotjawali TaxID=1550579 RepID=A0A0X8X504_9SPHI|nr:hypothetical protein MgSA37_01863 [Mucilaginibacter gotjawali]
MVWLHEKKIFMLYFLLFAVSNALPQGIAGTINGTIRNSKGELLAGALIKVTCIPTGFVYTAVSRSDGTYSLANLKNSGPYRMVVTLKRYQAFSASNIQVDFKRPLKKNVILKANADVLHKAASGLWRIPASTNTYQDMAFFTPQATPLLGATGSNPLDLSFAGQSNKYNLFTIDGAKAVNTYGLFLNSTNINPLPSASMRSLKVLLSPYDVSYGRFLGADINAVSNRGGNELRGTAYVFIQEQKATGSGSGNTVKYPDFINKVFGISIGGPVIRNKLFFFVNVDKRQAITPLQYDPTQANSGSKFDPGVLQGLQNYVKNKYGFDIGGYAGIERTNSTTSAFGRIDWDINTKNKLTFRTSYFGGDNFNITRSPTNIVFDNSAYTIKTRTYSTVLELNSLLSIHSSNLFRVYYNYVNNERNTPAFPSVIIPQGSLTYNLGGDGFSDANSLAQKDFNMVDYFTLNKGGHIITLGTDNDFYVLRNVFLQNFYGYYLYRSVEAFESNATPATYSVGYSTKGGADLAPDVMRVAQLAVFGQDVWQLTARLKVTYGLRVDKPLILNNPENNPGFNSSIFASLYGVATNKNPQLAPVISPRIGFNYDVFGDNPSRLRGGAGLFIADMPYILLSNQYANNGVNSIIFTGVPAGLTLRYNPSQPHLGAYIPPAAAAAPTEIDVTDPNFKLPKELHANLALDRTLPWDMIGTFEVLYSKKITGILYRNLNLAAADSAVAIGNTTRPFYNSTYLNKNYTDVIELTNTNKGYSFDLTVQLKKQITGGWSGMVAYTFGHSYSVNDVVGTSSLSNWRTAYAVNGLNNPAESNSAYDPGSRIIAYFLKTLTSKRFATNILLIYSGQTGQRYSYLYNYNITGDGTSTRYLPSNVVYIPTDASQFVPFSRSVNGISSTVSPVQQLADLQAYIGQNPALQKFEGKNTARNSFTMPWENHFDLKVNERIATIKISICSWVSIL